MLFFNDNSLESLDCEILYSGPCTNYFIYFSQQSYGIGTIMSLLMDISRKSLNILFFFF